jgi:hypothetical protein
MRDISALLKTAKTSIRYSCSIFVNPTQFNDPKDFAKYPVTIEQDIATLEKAGCDIVVPAIGIAGDVPCRHNRAGKNILRSAGLRRSSKENTGPAISRAYARLWTGC